MGFQASPRLTIAQLKSIAESLHGPITDAKRVANNTLQFIGFAGIKYTLFHRTIIAGINPDGSGFVTTGGFNTVTTRNRLNGFTPVRCGTRRGTLYINDKPCKFGGVITQAGEFISDKESAT
jgi:hypothetical protein